VILEEASTEILTHALLPDCSERTGARRLGVVEEERCCGEHLPLDVPRVTRLVEKYPSGRE
jgi:hypothetical protein